MSEINFSCPQCTQHITCDASYAGNRIECPACQRALLVPHPMTLQERASQTAATPPVEHSTTPRADPLTDDEWNRQMSVYRRLRFFSLMGGSWLGIWFWIFFLVPLLLFYLGIAFNERHATDFLGTLGGFLLPGLLPDDVSGSSSLWSNPFFYLLSVSGGISGSLLSKISTRNPVALVACSLVFTIFILGVDLFVCCFGGCAAVCVRSAIGEK